MTYLDTNVVIRWLLNDDPAHNARAQQIIESAPPASCLVTDVTLAEIFYVLRGNNFDRGQIVAYLRALLDAESLIFDQESRLDLLFTIIGNTKLDFADCYLISRAIYAGQPLKTFDKSMQKVYQKYKQVQV